MQKRTADLMEAIRDALLKGEQAAYDASRPQYEAWREAAQRLQTTRAQWLADDHNGGEG